MICSRCGKEHEDTTKFPPSLQGKLKICFKCYKDKKHDTELDWYKENKHRLNKLRQVKRKLDPRGTKEEWLDRTRRWRAAKKLKLTKKKLLET